MKTIYEIHFNDDTILKGGFAESLFIGDAIKIRPDLSVFPIVKIICTLSSPPINYWINPNNITYIKEL